MLEIYLRDMTFLYDSIIHEKPTTKPKLSKYDLSVIRANESTSINAKKETADLPDTLIPEEYKVLVNHGIVPFTVEKKYR